MTTHPFEEFSAKRGCGRRILLALALANTEKRDRGIKLEDYRLLPSLREYVIVSHVRCELEIWSRAVTDDEWTRRVFIAGQRAHVQGEVELSVDDLYRAPLPVR